MVDPASNSIRRWTGNGRERTRSESGKENSGSAVAGVRPATRQRRNERAAAAADSPVEFCMTDSAVPSDSDHPWGDQHSSEEELECINGPENQGPAAAGSPVGSPAGWSAGWSASALRFGPSAFGLLANDKPLRQRTITLLQQQVVTLSFVSVCCII